jgi:hypothetical protein
MTPQEQHTAALDGLDKATGRLREAEFAEMTARRNRKKISATMTAAEVSKIVLADETAREMFEAAKRDREAAITAVAVAEARIVAAERHERLRLQHEKGVAPIREIQGEIDRLLGIVGQHQAKQNAIFLTEVAPRNSPWTPQSPFERPPLGHYLSPAHVVDAGRPQPKEPEPLPTSTLAPKSGAPLSPGDRMDLLFCLDERGSSVVGDAQLSRGWELKDLYASAGDMRHGGSAIASAEFFAELRGAGGRGGLGRALTIAKAARGNAPTAEWVERRLGQLRGWVRPAGPLTPDMRPALDGSGAFVAGA